MRKRITDASLRFSLSDTKDFRQWATPTNADKFMPPESISADNIYIAEKR
jgi:hypothetical protein